MGAGHPFPQEAGHPAAVVKTAYGFCIANAAEKLALLGGILLAGIIALRRSPFIPLGGNTKKKDVLKCVLRKRKT